MLECFELFMHQDQISHLLFHSNARMADPAEHITSGEMKKWIGILIARTLSPIPNIDDLWRDEDDGFIPAHHCFATGPVGTGAMTFHAFRPIPTFFQR